MLNTTGGGSDSGGGGGGASNLSSASLATNSSRGNISQSGNQSNISASSHKSIAGHQQSSASSSSQQQNPNFDSNVISERVKNLATQIYQELKTIISRCNYDEDILSGLMPLIVRVLESLDLALIENQQLQVELELCKDDNDQLVIMFEKEKASKRAIDKKLIESEYGYEEERQQYQQKIESLDNQLKMFELKAKNASDQAARFEEKEAERKREYNKLHDRYTELLRSHCDVVERVRHLVGNNEVANLGSINVPQHIASSSDLTIGDLQSINKFKLRHEEADFSEKSVSTRTKEALKSWTADAELGLEDASLVVIDDIVGTSDGHGSKVTIGDLSSHNESDRVTNASEADGEHEKESENDSIAYTSMEKEFRKLIQENKDLLNTKNALNVVKDDLIADVDRLTNEVSMYEQAVEQLNSAKDQMKQKVAALDAELRKTKEELEKAKQKLRENNEEGVPYSQRKRFGRAEMAKVLMERNNYKERFMELQDAVRYTELVRANRMETEKRSGLWKFFSNLFGAPPAPRAILGSPRNSSPVISYRGPQVGASGGVGGFASPNEQSAQLIGSAAVGLGQSGSIDALQTGAVVRGSTGGVGGGGSIRSTSQHLSNNSDLIVLMDSDLNIDRSRAAREANGSMAAAAAALVDQSGYIHAYGWSLRASSVRGGVGGSGSDSSLGAGLLGRLSPKFSPVLGGTSSYSQPTVDPVTGLPSVAGEGSVSFGGAKTLAGLQVPIPQYCRPLTGDSLGMKIWCATAIDQSGGDLSKFKKQQQQQQQPQESITTATATTTTGSSTEFNNSANTTANFSDPNTTGSTVNISTSTPIKSPDQQALKQLEREVSLALGGGGLGEVADEPLSRRRAAPLRTTTDMVLNALPYAPDDIEELSSCVWICSAQHSRSKITIIDIKNKPNELLDSFYVPTFLYSIKSIAGCKPSDLLGIPAAAAAASEVDTDNDKANQQSDDEPASKTSSSTNSIGLQMIEELIRTQRGPFYMLVRPDQRAASRRAAMVSPGASGTSASLKPSGAGAAAAKNVVEGNEAVAAVSTGGEEKGGGGGKSHQAPQQEADDEDDAEISRILDNDVSAGIATLQKLNDFVAHTMSQPPDQAETRGHQQQPAAATQVADERHQQEASAGEDHRQPDAIYYQPISTHLPTVWMGGKDSVLYVHSAIGQWKDCVACVELRDSILQFCHFRGRVFVALADGSLCVFFRNCNSKQWEFSQYLRVDINLLAETTSDIIESSCHASSADLHSRLTRTPADSMASEADESAARQEAEPSSLDQELASGETLQTTQANMNTNASSTRRRTTRTAGIHCLEIANKNLWLGYRNRVLIFDPITLKLKHTFNVVPQVDNQIRQFVSMKDGVFICLRSDLTLRLYSSLRPYQHIQNIDIEPVVTRMISPKTFVISHITAMRVVDQTLWIGIAHGIILTIPCKLVPQISEAPMRNDVTGEFEESSSHLSIARFVPKCDIANAQISFHGHRDAVKFFVHAHNLMLSGGQGYLDFRLDMDDQSKAISDKSHLILWQLPSST